MGIPDTESLFIPKGNPEGEPIFKEGRVTSGELNLPTRKKRLEKIRVNREAMDKLFKDEILEKDVSFSEVFKEWKRKREEKLAKL